MEKWTIVIVFFTSITFVLVVWFVVNQLIFLKRKIDQLENLINSVDKRIDPIRLNFLWQLRIILIQAEKYELIQQVNEIIATEYGEEAVNCNIIDDTVNLL